FDSRSTITIDSSESDFSLEVSGTNDVHIALCPTSNEGHAFEIALGGWSNERSVVRRMPPALLSQDETVRGTFNDPILAVYTPNVLPEFKFVKITVKINSNGFHVFLADKLAIHCESTINFGEYAILYRSGWGCNAEWRFPHWPKNGAFLFKSDKQTSLSIKNRPDYNSLPFYNSFYQHYTRNHLYYGNDLFLKCDDDIVFIDLNGLKKFIDFRAQNEEYFIISANVINNGVCAQFQQRDGIIPKSLMELHLPPDGMCGSLWSNATDAQKLHNYFIDNFELFLDKQTMVIPWNQRISINFVTWLGKDFTHISEIMLDDEEYLSYQGRWRSGKENAIFTPFIVSHLSFFSQENGIDVAEIIEAYKVFANKFILS
ncbi:MAG: hypothetical protein POG24_00615, partial [Acidocella sp.]|nr:hypothetical protein [Acidocella sp.]